MGTLGFPDPLRRCDARSRRGVCPATHTQMAPPAQPIGRAVYLRTDRADYPEEAVPFWSLEELGRLCTGPPEGRVLERVVLYSRLDHGRYELNLEFISAQPNRAHRGPSRD